MSSGDAKHPTAARLTPMASSRTKKRKQQRLAAKIHRAEAARWAALTRDQKFSEDPDRLRNEDMLEVLRQTYRSYMLDVIAQTDKLLVQFTSNRVDIGGTSYQYTLHTNSRPREDN